MNLKNEIRMIQLINRITISDQDKVQLLDLCNSDLYWPEILRLAINNKVVGLLYNALDQLSLLYKVPSKYRRITKYFVLGNELRNNELFLEYENIVAQLNNNGVKTAPLKGCYLIPYIYQNKGIRIIGDIDLMIDSKDRKTIIEIMQSLGYVNGRYDSKTQSITEYSREKKLLWNTQMNNLPPFLKASESPYVDFYKFDFSFNLYPKLNVQPVPEMLSRAEYSGQNVYFLRNSDFFIHLCCHLHKEATKSEWIHINGDINFIKFCDVREFVLNKMNEEKFNEAALFADKYNLREAIYFTIYYLKVLYNDGYEDKILEKFNIEDKSFLNQYIDSYNNEKVEWSKDFWERLTSDSNKDALAKQSSFNENYEKYHNL